MNLFGLMETSGGAMQAERMRAEVVAANMANAETTRTAEGGPYRRQHRSEEHTSELSSPTRRSSDLETSGGAMQAERMRAEVVAANMANAETTRTAEGGPYRRQHVIFSANQGDPGFLDRSE